MHMSKPRQRSATQVSSRTACTGVDDCFTTDARGPWTELRDQIFSILKECSSNAREAADALRNIADSYATADQLNADELSQYEQYKVELIMDDRY